MNGLRVTALVALAVSLALLVSPAVASAPHAPAAAPASEGPYITAIGVGVVPPATLDPFAIGQTLYIGVQTTAAVPDVQSAADDLVARLDTIKAALVKVGVAAEGIRTTGLNVSPLGPSKPMAPGDPSQPRLSSITISGSLSAEVVSLRTLIAAMNVATENGATSVNANAGKAGLPYGTVQPSAAELAKVTQAAVANARVNAEALAAASGRRLGAIRSISSQQPPTSGCCPPNIGWMLQVTVTFDFAP